MLEVYGMRRSAVELGLRLLRLSLPMKVIVSRCVGELRPILLIGIDECSFSGHLVQDGAKDLG